MSAVIENVRRCHCLPSNFRFDDPPSPPYPFYKDEDRATPGEFYFYSVLTRNSLEAIDIHKYLKNLAYITRSSNVRLAVYAQ